MDAFYNYVNSKLSMSQRTAPIRFPDGALLIMADADKAKAFSDYFSSVYTPSTYSDIIATAGKMFHFLQIMFVMRFILLSLLI